MTNYRKGVETMKSSFDSAAFWREVWRKEHRAQREAAEKIRRNYPPAHTRRTETARTRRGYTQPRARIC